MMLDNPEDPYWHQVDPQTMLFVNVFKTLLFKVNLVLTQFSGLYHGYKEFFEKRYLIEELVKRKENFFMKIL
jgi:hypothetical protein